MADVDGVGRMKLVLMKEHPLMGYALSFMVGAYIAFMYKIPSAYYFALLLISIVAIIFLTLQRKRSWIFMIFIFAVIGYLLCDSSIPDWYKEGYVPVENSQIIGTVESVKSTGYSYEYILADVEISQIKTDAKIKVSNITQRDYIDAGDRIRLSGTLERPATAQQTGMFSEVRYYMTKDIQYIITIFDSWIAIIEKDVNTVAVNERMQDSIYNRLNNDFSQPVSGMLYSLSTGDKSYMDKEIYSACADLGIAHIFAISGLHIGALLLLWEIYCKKTKKRFLIKVLGSGLLVVLLYLIVGSRASLLRAIFMWALYVIYQYVGIKGELTDFLAIAMIGLLFINPLYVIDLGFLLSVSCVGAIGLVYAPIVKKKRDERFKKIINFYPVSMFIVSLSILSISWVVTAKAFGQVAILSPVWNVIFVPMIVVLISLMVGYALLFYIPIIGSAFIWVIDKFTHLIIYLVKVFSSINIELNMPKMGFGIALFIFIILLLMTDLIVKGRKKLRIIIGALSLVSLMGLILVLPPQEKMEVYAGYDSAFIYIYEDHKTILLLNEEDGGIRRVIEDIDSKGIDVFIYTGNDIEDLEYLINNTETINFKEVIVHRDVLVDYSGSGNYTGVDSFQDINIGNISIYIAPFQANKNAIVHYYAHIDYYDREFVYLDPLRLRDGTIDNCEIVICSRWTKQRIENVIYAKPQYVIMNSRDYLMDDLPISEDSFTVPTYNINNSGSFTYIPEGEKR